MSLLRFPTTKCREEYIEALKVIYTRPVAPGRFYLANAAKLNATPFLNDFLKSVLKKDDYVGTLRPVQLYLTNFEDCLSRDNLENYGVAHSYTMAHKKAWPPMLETTFLYCDEEEEDPTRLAEITWLKGNYSNYHVIE